MAYDMIKAGKKTSPFKAGSPEEAFYQTMMGNANG